MNELKPEDVMISCDTAQPSNEWAELREWRRRIYEAVNYRGTDDHTDVTTILLEYKKAILREKDAHIKMLDEDRLGWADEAVKVKMQLNEKDAEIERLTKERDDARRDCAVAEQLHYECKKELEEMSDDILDSVRAERDRYKAESERYQIAMLKKGEEIERLTKDFWGSQDDIKMRIADERAESITEFAERMEKSLTAQVNVSSQEILAAFMWCLDLVKNVKKELKGNFKYGNGNSQ